MVEKVETILMPLLRKNFKGVTECGLGLDGILGDGLYPYVECLMVTLGEPYLKRRR